MTWKLDEAIKELNEALATIKENCADEAKDDLMNDSKALAATLFEADCGWSVELGGVDWGVKDCDQPLTIYVNDHEGEGQLWKFDPIEFLLDGFSRCPKWVAQHGEPQLDDEERARLHRAIDALQSGIDRLKSYEARRDQAQS